MTRTEATIRQRSNFEQRTHAFRRRHQLLVMDGPTPIYLYGLVMVMVMVMDPPYPFICIGCFGILLSNRHLVSVSEGLFGPCRLIFQNVLRYFHQPYFQRWWTKRFCSIVLFLESALISIEIICICISLVFVFVFVFVFSEMVDKKILQHCLVS